MTLRRSPWIPVAASLLLFLNGCGGADTRTSGRRPGRASGPVPVATTEVLPRDLARTVTVAGSIEPIRTVSVTAQTSGTVLTVLVEEGDRVRPGQPLAKLDAREVSAQLERARAVLANAEAAFQRARDLRANDLTSDAEVDAARAAFGIAEADVQLWATRLAFCEIDAPIAGVVTAKEVEKGDNVSSGKSMFAIADDSTLVVRVGVSELDVVHLAAGRPVTLRLDAYPGAKVTGHIRRIFPGADAESRLVPVEVVLDAAPPGVEPRPGFLARVEFPLDTRSGVLVVPAAALGVSESGTFVYVVEADTLARRSVETGLTASGQVEITGGLRSGERVVTSGQVNLRPGEPVRVTSGSSGDSTATSAPDGSAP